MSGPGWIHEIKYDGYRIMAERAQGGTRLFTRNGHDWSARYPLVVAAVEALWARSCIIDGELAKCDERGLPVFDLLRAGPRAKIDVALFAFDLLELNGEDLRREPIEARKARLMKLLRHSDPHVRYPGRASVQSGSRRFRPAPFNSWTISRRTARPSSRMPASSATRASCRSAAARATSPADRAIGSRPKIRTTRRCCGCSRRIGMADRPSTNRTKSRTLDRTLGCDANRPKKMERLLP